MRASRAIVWLSLAALAAVGCGNTDGMLRDLSWGQQVKMPSEQAQARAKMILRRDFPAGIDPDRSDEANGDYWTVWNHKRSVLYRGTKRLRAHIKIDDLGNGYSRVGIAVVSQINDNIDNPDNVDEARWVRKRREPEMERAMEQAIARRYLDATPSKTWQEKHRDKPRTGLREDLIDRSSDVDLEAEDDDE